MPIQTEWFDDEQTLAICEQRREILNKINKKARGATPACTECVVCAR